MSRRVYLHIGAPKTGTTYVQDRLRLNRGELADHDVHYPLGRLGLPSTHFKPALDLIGREWGGARADARGSWDRLMRRVRRLEGNVVISHEILAAATPERVARAFNDLKGSEVHIVYSGRDLARQLPAEWQESVKQFQKMPYQRFLKKARTASQTDSSFFFWRAQGIPDVLTRWGALLPPERIHLVTVPQPGAPRDLLWWRFCDVVGIDPAWAPKDSDRGNTSLGSAETTLVRRLNQRLRRVGLSRADHQALVTELLVHQNLARRKSSSRTTLPPKMFDWVQDVSEQWIGWLEESGIDVVGDLDELRPVRPSRGGNWRDPDHPRPMEMLDAAVDGLVVMLREAARRPDPDRSVGGRVRSTLGSVRRP